MNKIVILFLILLPTSFVWSQNALGYLGKLAYVKAEGWGMLALGPTARNKGFDYFADQGSGIGESNGIGIDGRLGLQLGYTLSRQNVAVFNFNHLTTATTSNATTAPINNPGNLQGEDFHWLFYKLNGWSTGVGYQWFKTNKGAIAPLGHFIGAYLDYTSLKGQIIDKQTEYQYPDAPAIHGKLRTVPKLNYLSAGFEIGQNMIFEDQFLLTVSTQFNIPLLFMYSQPNYDADSPNSSHAESNQDWFNDSSRDRMLMHGLINFKIGVGYLVY